MPINTDPRYIGRAWITPDTAVVAGQWGTWTLTYEVGAYGYDEGARLKISWRFASDWGTPQFADPTGANYTTAADPLSVAEPGTLSRVRCFWEKPSLVLARTLWARGCLWNSFVMVGHAPAFLSLIAAALPDLDNAFAPIRAPLGTVGETDVVGTVYAGLPEIDFSRQVLATNPARLAVLPVVGVRWSDWGEPSRVLGALARIGVRPTWAQSPVAIPA